MLPQTTLGEVTDAQAEAQFADLQADIARRHADILKQLGYVDDYGNFIMGSVETEAQRQIADRQRDVRLAQEDVTNEMQRAGTLFSGYRGTEQARREHPFVSAIADINTKLPGQLSDLYEQAAGLTDEFTRGRNSILADAAARRAAALTQNPVTSGGAEGTADTGAGQLPVGTDWGAQGGITNENLASVLFGNYGNAVASSSPAPTWGASSTGPVASQVTRAVPKNPSIAVGNQYLSGPGYNPPKQPKLQTPSIAVGNRYLPAGRR